MAHKTGAAFTGGHIIHGAANAMYLPKVIRFNAKNPEAAERYAQIARFISLPGTTTDELVDALIEELRSMNRQLNIPLGIKKYGKSNTDTGSAEEMCIRDRVCIRLRKLLRHAVQRMINPSRINERQDEKPVSYTHLDVYKRQPIYTSRLPPILQKI